MTEQFAQLLLLYGMEAEIGHGDDTAQVRAFVQPITRKTEEPLLEDTNFGADDRQRWLYIGPKEQTLEAGDTVRTESGRFLVQQAAAVYVGAEKSHWWAILRPEREALA